MRSLDRRTRSLATRCATAVSDTLILVLSAAVDSVFAYHAVAIYLSVRRRTYIRCLRASEGWLSVFQPLPRASHRLILAFHCVPGQTSPPASAVIAMLLDPTVRFFLVGVFWSLRITSVGIP